MLRLSETRTDSGQSPIATAYGYDNNGNTVSKQKGAGTPTTYQWDALNRLTALTEDTGTSHSFGYDPNGIRAKTTTGPDSQRFLLAGEDIVEDLSGGNIATYYSHGPGIDEPLAQLKASATTPGYLHHDALGSVTTMTTSTGALSGANVYNAYGTVANDLLPSSLVKVDSRYGYTSRELDASGLMYYRARYMDANVGRFMGQDAFAGLQELPISLQKYMYGNGNPTNLVDPKGNFINPEVAKFIFNFYAIYVAATALIMYTLDDPTMMNVTKMGMFLMGNLLAATVILYFLMKYGKSIAIASGWRILQAVENLVWGLQYGLAIALSTKFALATLFIIFCALVTFPQGFTTQSRKLLTALYICGRNLITFLASNGVIALLVKDIDQLLVYR